MAALPTNPTERWRRRINQAREAQRPYWGVWATNLAFVAGQHWLVWDERHLNLRRLSEVDSRYRGRELFTADRITELRQAALGEMTADDDRPELLAAQEGPAAEQVSEMLNLLVGYAWDHEWEADRALMEARRICLDLGVAAIRCRWNPDAGPVTGHLPVGEDGNPLDAEAAQQLAATGQLPSGGLPRFKPVKEGRTTWEVYSPYQILVPPGVTHESRFNWQVLMRAIPVEEVEDTYGVQVREDTGITNTIWMPSGLEAQSGQPAGNRLRDHVWLYTCFEEPSKRNPQGQITILAGPDLLVVDQRPYDYQLCGVPHAGVVYLHWWRRADRFYSRSFVEPLKDPQRIINRRKTQSIEIVDRGMPKLIVRRGDFPENTTGAPGEIVQLERQAQQPVVFQGFGPGPWMYQDVPALDEDLRHASTLTDPTLGENPTMVGTYSQLALLHDADQGKRASIRLEHRHAIGILVQLGVEDVKRYWPDEKQALVAGSEEGSFAMVTFRKSQIPAEYQVRVPTGSALPRSQGAELKKVDSIWQAIVQSGLAATNPAEYTGWYMRSIEAGSPLQLPTAQPSTQEQLAEFENELLRQGENVVPTYYDDVSVHLAAHRRLEDEARAAGNADLAARTESHIQAHRSMEQANQQANAIAAQQAQLAAAPSPSVAAAIQQPSFAAPQAAGGAAPPQQLSNEKGTQ